MPTSPRAPKATMTRCPWSEINDLERQYHDEEWGVPQTDDQTLFEFLILEGAQAGLSWDTILKKRENYRAAFAEWDVVRVSRFKERDVQRLMANAGIVRNRLKIESAISNAQAFLEVQAEFGSFAKYAWGFVDGTPRQNACRSMRDVPASTPLSDQFSKDLKRRGFRFVGTTICYAFMQATGMVNDHLTSCPRYEPVRALGKKPLKIE
jgi:DNA-3-methyladenine glycosylase I